MSAPNETPLTGERKPVTALFADVVGSTNLAEALDPEDWAEVVNRLYEVASDAIARYEGTVTQLSGDAVVALFGAPVAHEDDPERAVRAALDLAAGVAELSETVRSDLGADLEVRVGVNTGLAVVGSVGGPGHEEYTALGDAMNVAARMQTAARPGSVLVTGSTHEHVAGLVDAVDRGALTVKGKREPVAAFEITSIRERGGRLRGVPGLHSAMVGRGRELEHLAGLLDVVRAGRGRMALVLGEPGIGKSRLLAELHARDGDLRWVEGRCLSYGHSLPYHLVADLVASMAGTDGEVSAEAIERLTGEVLGTANAELTGHLLHLLGLPTPPGIAEALAQLDPEAVRRRHVDAVMAVLNAMAHDRPLVLACEDLHWADASSVDMLVELARVVDRCPILLVATARPDRDSEGWRFVTEARANAGEALTELRLRALSVDESRTLVANLLEIESLPPDVRQLILARTDGNPFFVEEVIRAFIDEGLISRRGQRWVASGDLSHVDVPETVHGLLLGRIDRLPGDARRCLRVASVLGRTFAPSLLDAITDGPLDVQAELGTLEAHGLVSVAATRPGIRYAFRHALVQESAYRGLLRRERQVLHRRVADVLEEEHETHPEEIAALLAHHLDLAGEIDRAVPYLLTAASRALARHAYREAQGLFARGAELLGDRAGPDARRARVEARVGEVEAGRTFVPAGDELALLEAVLPEVEELGDERLLARVHGRLAEVLHYLGQLGDPRLRSSVECAVELGEKLGDDALVALPLRVRGEMAFAAGRYRDAITDYARAIDMLERRERLSDASMVAGRIAMAHAHLGEFEPADRWLTHAQRLAEDSGDPNAKLDVDLFRGVVETERGNLEEAVEHTRRGLEQAREVGNNDCALVGQFNLGDLHLRMGDPDAAIRMLEESNEMALYCNAGGFAALSEAWLAAARSRTGGILDEGLGGLDASLARARASGMAPGEAEIQRHRATVLAAQPDPDWESVWAAFEAAIAILDGIGARPALARTLHDYGMALDVAGRPARATAMLERAAALFDEMGLSPAS